MLRITIHFENQKAGMRTNGSHRHTAIISTIDITPYYRTECIGKTYNTDYRYTQVPGAQLRNEWYITENCKFQLTEESFEKQQKAANFISFCTFLFLSHNPTTHDGESLAPKVGWLVGWRSAVGGHCHQS